MKLVTITTSNCVQVKNNQSIIYIYIYYFDFITNLLNIGNKIKTNYLSNWNY